MNLRKSLMAGDFTAAMSSASVVILGQGGGYSDWGDTEAGNCGSMVVRSSMEFLLNRFCEGCMWPVHSQ